MKEKQKEKAIAKYTEALGFNPCDVHASNNRAQVWNNRCAVRRRVFDGSDIWAIEMQTQEHHPSGAVLICGQYCRSTRTVAH